MKNIRPGILVIVFMVLYPSSSSADTSGLKTQLNGSQIQLHSFDTNIFLLVNTEKPIEKPQELIDAFQCSLSGRHLLEGALHLQMSLLKYSLAESLVAQNVSQILKENITWDRKNPVPYTYVLSSTSVESGFVKCQDIIGIGLESKDVLHTALYTTSITGRYGVKSISGVVTILEANNYFPSLIFIDPDTRTDPEVAIRIESEDPYEEQQLRTVADDLAREGNWSVKYVRETLFCPSVVDGSLKWPKTKVGRRAVPIIPCINSDGKPSPSRRCLGSLFEGAYWEAVDVREPCLTKSNPSPALLAVIQNESEDTLKAMDKALKQSASLIGVPEVNLISLALSAAVRDRENVSMLCVADVVDKILETNEWIIKSAKTTSSSSETILDAIDQIMPRAESNSSSPILRKSLSVVSFHSGDSSPGFALVNESSMIVFAKDEPIDVIFNLRPKVAVYRLKGTNNNRMDYVVMDENALFKSWDLRRHAVAPVVGVGITEKMNEEEVLTVLIAFKRNLQDQEEHHCAMLNPKTDEDWSIQTLSCSKGKTSKEFGSPQMDLCLCNVAHNGFIFFTRIYEDKEFKFYKYYASDVLKPRLELLYKEKTSDVVLNVYNRIALDSEGPILSTLECSVNDSHMDEYPLGLNPRKPIVLYNYTTITTSNYLKNMAIIKVSYEGDGNITCRDRLGLGLVSNQVMARNINAALVRYRTGPLTNLDKFMADYALKYADRFRMVVRIQYQSSHDTEFMLQFSKKYETNYMEFFRNVTILSKALAQEYDWTVLYMRSTRYCFTIQEGGFLWPTTQLGHPAMPMIPCIDSRGIPLPTRHCLGDYKDGSYWESVPKRPDLCLKPSHRAERLRNITSQENKMDAIDRVSDDIKVGPTLNPYEIWIMSRLLKDAADEVSDTASRLKNVSSFATIVNSMQEAGKDVLRMADAATGSSYLVRESIDVLLATAASSTPTVISKPHFSALTASLDSDVRGFVQDKSVPIGKSMITLRGNTTIDEIVRSSPNVAAYFRTVDLQKGVITSTLFHDDSLFGAPTGGMLVNGPVVGMTLLSEVGEKFLEYDQPLELLLLFPRGASDPLKRTCQFWDPNEEGGWSGVGCELLPEGSFPGITDMDACVCTHITYFALLILSRPISVADVFGEKIERPKLNVQTASEDEASHTNSMKQNVSFDPMETHRKTLPNESTDSMVTRMKTLPDELSDSMETEMIEREVIENHERYLHILSLVGCSISFFSLLNVLILALILPKYRSGNRRIIHLNITASQALFMGLYIVISLYGRPPDTEEIKLCVAMGVILHYSFLVSFFWTFMAALFLYLKFNPELRKKAKKIVGTRYVLRAALITWGAPGIFVVGVLLAGTDQYSRRPRTALCYPEGAALYVSVIFPVSLICVFNFVVYFFLVRSIFFLGDRSNETPVEEDDPKPTFQFFTVVSYFFFLGLFWGLGLVMNITTGKALIYLAYAFCATATLQGFSFLFLFVIRYRGGWMGGRNDERRGLTDGSSTICKSQEQEIAKDLPETGLLDADADNEVSQHHKDE